MRVLPVYNNPPDANGVEVNYTGYQITVNGTAIAPTSDADHYYLALPSEPKAGTFAAGLTPSYGAPADSSMFISDKGDGTLIDIYDNVVGSISGTTVTLNKSALGSSVTNITYDTHQIDAQSPPISIPDTVATAPAPVSDIGTPTVTYAEPAAVEQPKSSNVTMIDNVAWITLLPDKPQGMSLVVNSLMFELDGELVVDREGALYKNIDPTTGAGELVGILSHATTSIKLERVGWQPKTVRVIAGILSADSWGITQMYGRTPFAPVKPSSFTIRGLNKAEGTFSDYVGTAQPDGTITGDLVGEINVETGFYEFAPSLAGVKLAPESIKINFVSYSYLPLDADRIGLDATRLPADGRVPIYRRGDMIILTHAKKFTLPTALTAGQVITLPRGDLDKLCLLDANNDHVLIDHYTPDLASGKITMVDKVDLSNYQLPLIAVVTKDIGTPTPAQVIDTGIIDALMTVSDAVGTAIDTVLYTVNTATGQVSFVDPLDLSSYQMPLTVTARLPLGSEFAGGQTVALSGTSYDSLTLTDNSGAPLDSNLYSKDLIAGTVIFPASLDLSKYQLPLTAVHAIEARNRVVDLAIDGVLTLQFPLKKDFVADETYVSSALLGGDLIVSASDMFSQSNWSKEWLDTRVGDPILAQYNDAIYPVELTGKGAVSDRIAFIFTSTTTFDCFGEQLGFIGQGDIYTDFVATNLADPTSSYFVLRHQGWGGGWSTGNVLRTNIQPANMAVWLGRATMPSDTDIVDVDGFTACVRGNTIKN